MYIIYNLAALPGFEPGPRPYDGMKLRAERILYRIAFFTRANHYTKAQYFGGKQRSRTPPDSSSGPSFQGWSGNQLPCITFH